tara:strand:- start:181 stop:573 length:393 start_codon:yes stop_codon:yes gene_type:complete
MVTLTESAANVLRVAMTEQTSPVAGYVRVGVKAGGCSGFTYTIDFDSQPRKFDLEFESQNIPILCDKKSHLYIKETIIGWSNELRDKGFKFDNPHAKGSCGCRTSFQIDLSDNNNNNNDTPSWMVNRSNE